MPRKKRYDYTWEEYLEIKKENKRKLDEILATPNYQEVYGKKWYGDNWISTLYGNHPARWEKSKENQQRAYKKLKGEYVEPRKTKIQLPILQYEKNGEVLVKRWESLEEWMEVEQTTKAQALTILKAVQSHEGFSYGYFWKFEC